MKTPVALIISIYAFLLSAPLWGEISSHTSSKDKSRPVAPSGVRSPTEYVEGRWVEGSFQYKSARGSWEPTSSAYRADKDGMFLNAQGAAIDYKKGDILFKVRDSGWFKAKKDSPVSDVSEDPAIPNPQGVELSETERLIVRFTNLERMKRGLAPLKVSPQLQTLTERKAENMAKSRNLSHSVAPLPPGGENIAWNQASAREVVNSWMNSDGHRANILNRNYTTIGVGVAQGNGPYWAQMFK
ncbi:MAG: CAP domain-containing protein [Proteobacteria bacterium]|nr:CAP domain-containing protein [Pseudomonadota bacterium]NDC24214.1 CAP domain-containing protein [Pseudomonadota bacterium]NDD04006.1 CAP domain-containing protein [Pseudomonadota bacterium]NDG27073.1 CAP domain-containing protein [Pseudomonadota bacterium]